jgi:hypothetical protein
MTPTPLLSLLSLSSQASNPYELALGTVYYVLMVSALDSPAP